MRNAPVGVVLGRARIGGHEFVATGHPDLAEQSVALLTSPELDRARANERAEQEGLPAALAEAERLEKRLARGDEITSYELHELARHLREGSVD